MANESSNNQWSHPQLITCIKDYVEKDEARRDFYGYFEETKSSYGYRPLQVEDTYNIKEVTINMVIKMMEIRDKAALTQMAMWGGHKKYYGSIFYQHPSKKVNYLFDRDEAISWLKGDIISRQGRLISAKPSKECLSLIQALPEELLLDIEPTGNTPGLAGGKKKFERKKE